MIPQISSFEKSQNAIFSAMSELKIARLLHNSNIRKSCGITVFKIFELLILLVFKHKNLFQHLTSKHNDHSISKNAVYRFLSNPSFNWKRFLLLLSVRVTTEFRKLTCKNRISVLILDDSVTRRNRSKVVELLAKVYDHVFHEFVRGFNLLAIGWSDGFSFVPVSFTLLSSAKKSNRYQEASKEIDHRSNGWKTRVESMLSKPEAAFNMVKRVLEAGIEANYILMDSWFTTEPFIKQLSTLGMDVIGRIKDVKQRYLYNGKRYTLPQLSKIVLNKAYNCQYRSIVVKTNKHNITVRLVFVRSKNNKNNLVYLLTTDTSLSEDEIIRIYGIRWKIETFFKASKSLLKLCDEFQTRNYDSAVAHTAIVFTRYTLLEWLRRQNNDPKTYGGLFFELCDDVQDIDLIEALTSLMTLFIEIINDRGTENTEFIKSKVAYWIASQRSYIKDILPNLCWES